VAFRDGAPAVNCATAFAAGRGTMTGVNEPTFTIRHYRPEDWSAVLAILQATFAGGDTYAYAPDSSADEIHQAWIEVPLATYVACGADGRVLGTYTLKPNQPGLGAHVCNCGYVVAADAQGGGIATAMCIHSQQQALAMGFRGMQFNLVVATNTRAIRLWQRLGFRVIGVLPRAFQHARLGDVDALVMHKLLG
jgi:ribosomal protein S18 acetylase RimI-like enzyme